MGYGLDILMDDPNPNVQKALLDFMKLTNKTNNINKNTKMNKEEILNELRAVCDNYRIKFPKNIGFEIEDKSLYIKLLSSELVKNMQTDAAAFEAWALVLKCYLPKLIHNVVIDWDPVYPKALKNGNASAEKLHYNRFKYRLSKFLETYPWTSIKEGLILDSIPGNLICNCPKDEAADNDNRTTKDDEYDMECRYVKENIANYDFINHQLPVGLFVNEVSSKDNNAYTTGKKGAIDIWAIKDATLYLFELKKNDNKKVGIISELMFYTNVISGIIKYEIKYADGPVKDNYRGFNDLYTAIYEKKIKEIRAIMLADSIHPLIKDGLIEFLNKSTRWESLNVSFSHQKTGFQK